MTCGGSASTAATSATWRRARWPAASASPTRCTGTCSTSLARASRSPSSWWPRMADSVVPTDAEYAAACGKVAGIITAILEAEPETRELDALDLWDWMGEPALFGVDPETSVMQWSMALDVVR